MCSKKMFCTYCSHEKDEAPGLLPARARYRSDRIKRVSALADQERVGFGILSGEFGLVLPHDLIPYYDHLLAEGEVHSLSDKVANQLQEKGIRAVVYFTHQPEDNPLIRPYLAAIKRACAKAEAILEVRQFERRRHMSDFRRIMTEAERCKNRMLTDRLEGEESFGRLIEQHPTDGMVRLKRGESYEALGDYSRALADYEEAGILLPMANWKATAREATERMKCSLSPSATPYVSGDAVLEIGKVLQVIKDLENLLDRMEDKASTSETLNDRIKRLENDGLIPRDAANHMHYLKNTRNELVHSRKSENLTGPAVAAFMAAWSAVKDWALRTGHKTEDLP